MSNVSNKSIPSSVYELFPYVLAAVAIICLFDRILKCCLGGKPRVKETINNSNISDEGKLDKGKGKDINAFKIADGNEKSTKPLNIEEEIKKLQEILNEGMKRMEELKSLQSLQAQSATLTLNNNQNVDTLKIANGNKENQGPQNNFVTTKKDEAESEKSIVTFNADAEISAENEKLVLDTTQDVVDLINRINLSENLDFIKEITIFSLSACGSKNVNDLLKICSKLSFLHRLNIENANRNVWLQNNIPSLKTLIIGDVGNVPQLGNFENLEEIRITSLSMKGEGIGSLLSFDAWKSPELRKKPKKLRSFTINSLQKHYPGTIKCYASLKEICINSFSKSLTISDEVENLVTLILGDKGIEKGDSEYSIQLIGNFKNLRLLHTRSCIVEQYCEPRFVFSKEALNPSNFPALLIFKDESPENKRDPQSIKLAKAVDRRCFKFLFLINLMYRCSNKTIEPASIFSVVPNEIIHTIVNIMLEPGNY